MTTGIFLTIEITTMKKVTKEEPTNEGLPSGLPFGFEFIFKAVLLEDHHDRQERKKWEWSWTRNMRG